MSDSIWEELVRSPLDPDPNEPRLEIPRYVPVALAGLIGLLLGLLALAGGGEASTTTEAAVSSTTTTAEVTPPDPEVPEGYIDVDGVGVRAIASYARAGNLYIVVNEATRSDLTPAETPAFHAAEWILRGDGTDVTASRSISSHLAPGMTVVEFVGVEEIPGSEPMLEVRSATDMVVRTGCHGCAATSVNEASGDIVLETLDRPLTMNKPMLIDVGDAITLSIDSLEATDDWGYVAWHIVDENEARARADIRVVFDGTDDPGRDGINPTQLVPENLQGPSQQNPTTANPQSFTRSGQLMLDRVGELISDTNTPTALILRWNLEWQHPIGQSIEIPLTSLADLGIIG